MLKKTTPIILSLLAVMSFAFLTGCESDAGNTALVGAGIGAGIGALAGGDSEAIAIGAAAGGAGGYMIGNESDKKKERARTDRELAAIRAEANTQVVWITNTNGSKVSVTLRKSGPNYIGPKGELYTSMPTEDQLRPVYGF